MPLPPKLRRAALETLGRDRLVALAGQFEVEVADRRSTDAAVDALNRSKKLDFAALLGELSRDELTRICGALQLDDSGKEKGPIDERIIATGDQSDEKAPRGSAREQAILGAAELLVAESTCCETCIECRAVRADVARVAVSALGWDGSRRLGLRAVMQSPLVAHLIPAWNKKAQDASQRQEWHRLLEAWFEDSASDPHAMAFLVNRVVGDLPDGARRRCLEKAEKLAIASLNVDLVRILLRRASPVPESVLRVAGILSASNAWVAKDLRRFGRADLVATGADDQRQAHARIFDAIRRRDRAAVAALLLRRPDLQMPGPLGLSPIEYMRKHRPELADLFG